MAIMLHPNKENPQRYRVFDKETSTQAYYSFAKHGKDQAEKLAIEHEKKVQEKKLMRSLIKNLDYNKIFDDKGNVRGLRRIKREREGRATKEYLTLRVTVGKNTQKGTDIGLDCRSFDEAYKMAQDKILALHNIESSLEIRQEFKKAKKLYW